MKVLLMHPDRDFDLQAPEPPQVEALIQDLELDTLFDAVAGGDDFLRAVAKAALLQSLTDAAQIAWRQAVLKDCERHHAIVETLHQLALDTLQEERRQLHFRYNSASGRLMQGVGTLERCHERLRTLRQISDEQLEGDFQSKGFTQFFEALHAQLDDAYLAEIAAHLKELRFKYGTFTSAQLGDGSKSAHWVLHNVPRERRGRWRHWLMPHPEIHAFEIAPRDEAGGRALEALGMPVCYPEPQAAGMHCCEAEGLYDACLCLTKSAAIVGNDVSAHGMDLIFVTGANQGGKSTFLRSLGVAQLLLQAGLPAPARRFSADICSGLFTHYKREEDASMASGKFDEELVRMDAIVEHILPGAMLLFNESFAATNEHEGAAIAAEIIEVLLEKHIKVVFVTHFYELALNFSQPGRKSVLFLKAERSEDGTRSYRIRPGRPSRTAHGRDLYARIFVDDAHRPDCVTADQNAQLS